MFKKFFLSLSIAIFSQTNCWKEIVPKSERFPLAALPAELISHILTPEIKLPETLVENGYIPEHKIFGLFRKVLDTRKDLINNYLRNLSRSSKLFDEHSKRVLSEFDNKIIKEMIKLASMEDLKCLTEDIKNEKRFKNDYIDNLGQLDNLTLSKKVVLSTLLVYLTSDCKCPKFHHNEFTKKLIDAGADMRWFAFLHR